MHYEILRSLGKGGMGEVFLAKDPVVNRLVALKKIRQDLAHHKTMRERFLREARTAAQLVHPSIIAIYTISQDKENIYYTMPYIEGETLAEMLKKERAEKKDSIPTFMRIFLSLCQAIAYVHSRGILHRDLKPDNILIGKYGEVVILDWGLAGVVGKEDTFTAEESAQELTIPGKIPGTLSHMAPERALGEKSSFSSDIYALGVILYQMLTLQLPFQRTTLADFRKWVAREELMDPIEIAPFRDIPPQLALLCTRSLHPKKEQRIQSVQQLVDGISSYVLGNPEWIETARLDIYHKEDWEFQENVLLTKHLAITHTPDSVEWVNLMISRSSFLGNVRMDISVCLKDAGAGIGVLLCIPETKERVGLFDGYGLWLSSAKETMSKLFRSNVEVMSLPNVHLEPHMRHTLIIEKLDNHISVFLDGKQICKYVSHLPMIGTHVGFFFRDAHFHIEPVKVFLGSHNVQVSCLSIPDAFLANRFYKNALLEYRRISSCFPGRIEGREALFRAGITLLEQALHETKKKKKQYLLSLSLEEFGKLKSTPGAPLEYLGKSLVYKALDSFEDESKCLELALRKYPTHPLRSVLQEEIVFRLHESSTQNRKAGYLIALLAMRYMPEIFQKSGNQTLFENLKKHIEPLFFVEKKGDYLSIELAFWLAQPFALLEIYENAQTQEEKMSALFCLLYLDQGKLVKGRPAFIEGTNKQALEKFFGQISSINSYGDARRACFLFDKVLDRDQAKLLLPYTDKMQSSQYKTELLARLLRLYLLENALDLCEPIFRQFSQSELERTTSPLFSLWGCYLKRTRGKEAALAHLALEETVPLRTSTLLAHYVQGAIDPKELLDYEKVELKRALRLWRKR